MDDELKGRLNAADPARHHASADSWIDDLVEKTMNEENDETAPARRRPWMLVAAAAAAVAVIGGGTIALTADGDDGDKPATEAKVHKVLDLTLGPVDSMQMCIQFSPEALEPLQVAFSGEVYEVDGDTVRITPDHWYRGGDGANDVTLTAGSAEVLLEGGITFEEGERYLIGADGDTVATCGLSGPYTEEMAAAYEQAFGG
ncbi:hypothetical protein F0U44_11495 [Nocardioides humilatus]|uniref:Uncharacterized protein n=1 Tax=Nocardioides humilatus TaxID=2607660 RepID=A0A5B1LFX6_9ACTN|nr:hypothetical protein [Nocardioides humilatus]KAA1419078.1 hypothetical protein F0U44_11495 [Nocardioides humilatus]